MSDFDKTARGTICGMDPRWGQDMSARKQGGLKGPKIKWRLMIRAHCRRHPRRRPRRVRLGSRTRSLLLRWGRSKMQDRERRICFPNFWSTANFVTFDAFSWDLKVTGYCNKYLKKAILISLCDVITSHHVVRMASNWICNRCHLKSEWL